jgi:hypothetical protein
MYVIIDKTRIGYYIVRIVLPLAQLWTVVWALSAFKAADANYKKWFHDNNHKTESRDGQH